MSTFWKPARSDRREVLQLAVPIMLASLSQTLMSVIDIAMVGRLGAAAVAAVGLGGILTYAFTSFLNSIQAGVQTVVARREGEGKHRHSTEAVRVGLYFSMGIGTVVTLVLVSSASQIYPFINNDPEVITLGIAYLEYRGFSVVMAMTGFVFYGFYNGISRPRIHLVVSVLANTLNVILNYGLIFGRLGLPEMGTSGAGLATSLASFIGLVLYAAFTQSQEIRRRYPGIWRGPYRLNTLLKILRIAYPASLQNLGVMLGFTLFMMIMGWVSTVALAATEIVFNILSFSFMPAMGFLYANQTLVSEYLGRNQPERAATLSWTTTLLSILFMGTMGLLFIAFPQYILELFTTDGSVVQTGIQPLRILGVVQFFDAVGMAKHGSLRGAGDTLFPAIADLTLMWGFFIPVTYITSIYLDWGILGGWVALAVYIALYAVAVLLRFMRGSWKKIVI